MHVKNPPLIFEGQIYSVRLWVNSPMEERHLAIANQVKITNGGCEVVLFPMPSDNGYELKPDEFVLFCIHVDLDKEYELWPWLIYDLSDTLIGQAS